MCRPVVASIKVAPRKHARWHRRTADQQPLCGRLPRHDGPSLGDAVALDHPLFCKVCRGIIARSAQRQWDKDQKVAA